MYLLREKVAERVLSRGRRAIRLFTLRILERGEVDVLRLSARLIANKPKLRSRKFELIEVRKPPTCPLWHHCPKSTRKYVAILPEFNIQTWCIFSRQSCSSGSCRGLGSCLLTTKRNQQCLPTISSHEDSSWR